MADDTKTSGETPEQQIEKELASYDASSPDAKTFYLALAGKINRFCPENDTNNMLKGLEFRIELLEKTPETILHFNFPGQNKKHFLESAAILLEYKKYYWKSIKYEFCKNLSGRTLKAVTEEAFKIIYEINEILKYHKRIESDSSALLENGKMKPDYEHRSSTFKDTADSGKERLESIIPLFSVWGGMVTNFSEKIDESIKIVSDKVAASEKLYQSIQRKGVSVSIERAIGSFQEVANKHDSQAKNFLRRSLYLGLSVVVWGVASIIWGIVAQKYFLSSGCKSSFYCWLFVFPMRELLVGGVLIGGMYACLRTYFANRHSASINRQRCNVLSSYDLLYKSVSENEKPFIIQKAVEAIYDHVPTGFTKYYKEENSKSTDSGQLATLVAALIRSGQGGGGT